MESNDSNTASSTATTMTAAAAITTIRERCVGELLVRTIIANIKAEVRINPPHAARENASRIASATMPSAIALRNDFRAGSETTLCKRNKAGRSRNAPNTFGSLNVPRPRSYNVSRSRPPGTRWK